MPAHEHILSIHQKRAANSLAKLLEAYLSGEIAHESELLSRLSDEYAAIFANLKDPLLQPEPMRYEGFLRLSAITKPMIALDEDLSTAYEQIDRLRDAVVQSQNICAVERAGLDELLSLARDRITEVRAWTSDSDPTFKWASDTFKSFSKVNQDASTAWIDTRLGITTLAVTGQSHLADRISRVAVKYTNPDVTEVEGLPGNWLEITTSNSSQVLSEIKEPVALTFANQSYKPSSSPAAMFDGEPTTWFEWERYLVPKTQRLSLLGETAWVCAKGTTGEMKEVFGPNGVTLDYGWDYKVHWPGTQDYEDAVHRVVSPVDAIDRTLSLSIEIEFDAPQELSWLELLPYLAGEKTYDLSSLQVSPDGTSDWTELLGKDSNGNVKPLRLNTDLLQPIDAVHEGIPVKDHRGVAVVPCRLPRTKVIQLEFTQYEPYETLIGHRYFLKTTVTQKSKSSWFGLSKKSSSSTRKFRVPDPTLNPATSSGGSILGWGSKSTTTETDLDTYYDIFKAYRFCIGIRDLGLLKRSYAESSKVISRPHRFDKDITTASVIVSENIPEGWDTSKKWITYELSHDGANWQTVSPQNTEGSAEGVVHFPATKQLFFRATLTRPADKSTESPVLEYYAIKAVPES